MQEMLGNLKSVILGNDFGIDLEYFLRDLEVILGNIRIIYFLREWGEADVEVFH